MDISTILEQIKELQAEYDSCQETIKVLRAYGASWALDCREMRIAESNGSHVSQQIRKLKAQIEQMAVQAPPENQDMVAVLLEIVRERIEAAGGGR